MERFRPRTEVWKGDARGATAATVRDGWVGTASLSRAGGSRRDAGNKASEAAVSLGTGVGPSPVVTGSTAALTAEACEGDADLPSGMMTELAPASRSAACGGGFSAS